MSIKEVRFTQNWIVRLLAISALLAVSACSSKEVPDPREYVESAEQPRFSVGSQSAEVPPGVVRYCWEEPIVAFEQNGPGLDEQGHWYHPSYVAVRQVRAGRWRPCAPELEREVR